MALARNKNKAAGLGAQRELPRTPQRMQPPEGGGKGRPTMLAVLQQFRVVVRSIRMHYDRVEMGSGVSGAQLWALARVEEQPGIKVGELARALAIHQSTASNILERLVSLGLVTKRRVGGDQRVVSVFATPRGKAVLKSAPQPLIGVLQQALSELPPAALRGLHLHLAAVIRTMRVKDPARARATPLSDI